MFHTSSASLYVNATPDTKTDYHENITNTSPSPIFFPCDNPRNIISRHTAKMVDTAVYAGIFPVFLTCGSIGNVINMAVFARQGLSDRINLCLFSLAASDACFLLFLMCGKSYALIALVVPEAGDYWHKRHQGPVLGNYLGFHCLSNLITALVAVERCLCVLWPLKGPTFFRTEYLAAGVGVSAVFILGVMNVALGVKYDVDAVTHPLTNATTYVNRLSPFYIRHRTLIDVLYLYILLIALPFLSLIIVIVCTAAVIFQLKTKAAWRRENVSNMTSTQKNDVLVTRMLVTVCVVYVICMVPNLSKSTVLFLRLPGFLMTGHLCNAFHVTLVITHVFEAFNASINICIYVKHSSRYRDTLERICRNCLVYRLARKGKVTDASSLPPTLVPTVSRTSTLGSQRRNNGLVPCVDTSKKRMGSPPSDCYQGNK